MKTKKISQKLGMKKMTVANLNSLELNELKVKGGLITDGVCQETNECYPTDTGGGTWLECTTVDTTTYYL